VVALQALSGTGSLRVGAAFIAKFLPGTKVYLSNPTWGNHNNIFADAGVPAEKYRCSSASRCRDTTTRLTYSSTGAPQLLAVLQAHCH